MGEHYFVPGRGWALLSMEQLLEGRDIPRKVRTLSTGAIDLFITGV